MKKYAVIVAGGSGSRMGTELPKQFMTLRGKPILYYSVNAFREAYSDVCIILVVPETHMDRAKKIINTYFNEVDISIVTGGDTRFQSVKNGLARVIEESIVFVHDGVRCLLSSNLVHRCYDTAFATGSAIPVIPSKDSVRLLQDDHSEPVERDKVMLVQTPQTFHSKIILPAYQIDYKEKFTDEATVVEAFGLKVSLVEGEDTNIKITKPVDLIIAEKIMESFEKESLKAQ
jgi:2-C-methyl-D-erythritol 4-phosphate cytidylyltransferase